MFVQSIGDGIVKCAEKNRTAPSRGALSFEEKERLIDAARLTASSSLGKRLATQLARLATQPRCTVLGVVSHRYSSSASYHITASADHGYATPSLCSSSPSCGRRESGFGRVDRRRAVSSSASHRRARGARSRRDQIRGRARSPAPLSGSVLRLCTFCPSVASGAERTRPIS